MTLERHMFVNYDSTTLTIEIKAYENVGVFYMLPEGEDTEELVTTYVVPQNEQYVIFEMHIPAEGIYGFGVYSSPEYTNPDEEHLTIVTGSGKSPWPSPPPPPPSPYDRTGYADRAADFLMALSAERPTTASAAPEPPAPVALKPTGTR